MGIHLMLFLQENPLNLHAEEYVRQYKRKKKCHR